MVHPYIQEIFDAHVRRYEALGNGNFGIRDGFLDPQLQVRATNSYDGSLVFGSD